MTLTRPIALWQFTVHSAYYCLFNNFWLVTETVCDGYKKMFAVSRNISSLSEITFVLKKNKLILPWLWSIQILPVTVGVCGKRELVLMLATVKRVLYLRVLSSKENALGLSRHPVPTRQVSSRLNTQSAHSAGRWMTFHIVLPRTSMTLRK